MIKNWIIQLVIGFVLTKIEAATGVIDWAALQAEVETYVAKFLPSFMLPMVDGVIADTFAALQLALADTADISLILTDLANGAWADALTTLQTLLAKVVHPTQGAVAAAAQSLKAA